MSTLIFKINLLDNKKISREIEILENISLFKLAEAILGAYNFNFDHCFGFFSKISKMDYFDSDKKYELFTDLIEEGQDIEPTGAGSVKKTTVKDVWKSKSDKMLFLFDYGDCWLFEVKLIDFAERESNKKYPQVLRKTGRAPRQY